MYECNFVNSVVPRADLEAEVAKYASACAKTRPTDTIFMQKVFFEIMKQHQGEYMGSLLERVARVHGRTAAGRRRRRKKATLSQETMDAGLNLAVKDNDSAFPPEWRLSRSGRRRATTTEGGPVTDEHGGGAPAPVAPLAGRRVVDLSSWIGGAYCTKLLADGGAEVIKVESPDGDPLRRWSASGAPIAAESDGALFNFLAASKRSVVVDPDQALISRRSSASGVGRHGRLVTRLVRWPTRATMAPAAVLERIHT